MSPKGSHASLGPMRKDVAGTVASQTSAGRWPVGLSSAAQLLGEVAVGIFAGAPGVLAYRTVLIAAVHGGDVALRSLNIQTISMDERQAGHHMPPRQTKVGS
jgi:hypothetical protein